MYLRHTLLLKPNILLCDYWGSIYKFLRTVTTVAVTDIDIANEHEYLNEYNIANNTNFKPILQKGAIVPYTLCVQKIFTANLKPLKRSKPIEVYFSSFYILSKSTVQSYLNNVTKAVSIISAALTSSPLYDSDFKESSDILKEDPTVYNTLISRKGFKWCNFDIF